jgi:putative ABC transport system ATP-binding protein
LDYATGKTILKLLHDACKQHGKTVIIVTHNDAIGNMAHRILRLREGVITENTVNQNRIAARDLEW